MWPIIFGPGWLWGMLTASLLACILVGFIGFLRLVLKKEAPDASGPNELWHRYEEGDLTREEFERLSRQRRARPT